MDRLNLETLINEWKTDSKVNITEPGQELLRNPILHQKYATQLHLHSVAGKGQKMAYNRIRRSRSDYYAGRMSEEDLKKNGLDAFPLVLKSDIGLYLDSDPELQKIEQKIILHDEARDFCLSILKAINNRSYDLRGFIDWTKYIQGGGSV